MIFWIDYWLNKVSMYRLVTISLTLLWLSTFVFSLVGILDYSSVAIIVSAATLIGSSLLSNFIVGKVAKISTHNESAYITGLILFFILSPSIDPRMLVIYLLAGIFATASKYLLIIRGRHIFNPAVIAATMISLLGLTSVSWWVATPLLAPLTLLLICIILYKTRKLTMAIIFLAIAVPIVFVTLLSYGSTILESLALLPSWPFLFFVGFILSEPLTLPAKKWQLYTETVVVGLLFAIPFSIGSFTIVPTIALLVGNILAYLLTSRQKITMTLVDIKELTPSSKELSFRLENNIQFDPGQYIEITLPHHNSDGRGLRRIFSITSTPNNPILKLGIKFSSSSSSFKKAIQALRPNAIINATTIGGDFTLPKNSSIPLVFIAGGIGITPFISHLRYLQEHDQTRDITLLYAVHNINDLAYKDVLKNSGINKVFVITQSKATLPCKSWELINASFISKKTLINSVPNIVNSIVYISGPTAMVRQTKKYAKNLRAMRIKTDYFTGY